MYLARTFPHTSFVRPRVIAHSLAQRTGHIFASEVGVTQNVTINESRSDNTRDIHVSVNCNRGFGKKYASIFIILLLIR